MAGSINVDFNVLFDKVQWRDWKTGLYMKMPAEARAACFAEAEYTAELMRAKVPISRDYMQWPSSHNQPSGRLHDAIGAYPTDKGGRVVWDDFGHASHWRHVEYGTTDHPQSGPKGITFYAKKGPRFGYINVPSVHHPGTEAQPYVRPSLTGIQNRLFQRVVRYLRHMA
jgi:hypothetical protein